jgi:hypothetical protein
MKKQKVKPSSNVAKVLDLMKADTKISVKEIVEKTNIKTSNVYAIRNYIKKNGLLKTLPMTGVAPKVRMKQQADNALEKEISNLLKENKQLTEWTVMWKRKYETLEQELKQAKILFLDQLAVVRYLEAKLLQLVEAKIKDKE